MLGHRLPILLRRLLPSLARALALAGLLPVSSAAAADPLGFQIQVPAGGLVVHENSGQATVTVIRDRLESGMAAQVRYITSGNGYDPGTNGPFDCGGAPCSATSYDFTSVKGELAFRAGQRSASFAVPITDHGTDSVPKTCRSHSSVPIRSGSGRCPRAR